MRMAVDVMGGDHAPDAILKGCLAALELMEPTDELVLVGPRAEIGDALSERRVRDPRVTIEHASEVIGMDESPVDSVKAKRDSSIVRMALLGSRKAERRCDFVLSAGNTGACVSAATMHMRRLPGVHRPGIAVAFPNLHGGPVILCDAGANPEPRPSHLWQYGLMAETYARQALGIARPRVAMMNIGAEEAKGTDLIRGASELLRATPDLNYVGFIEGRDFFEGATDVVVTDGFVGNTMLKMAEGLSRSLVRALTQEIISADPALAVALEPVFKSFYAKNDYHEYGGAPLLGVNGVCMIAHGSSEARTIRNAIRNSMAYVKHGVNDAIVSRLAALERAMAPLLHKHEAPAA
ncbi:MAG: phosphate acyltransferase PlsX [Phycisphaerae bacterium]|nr:phosphate acyltransferase PlsX [Phycisphaerae bacterium]